MNLLGVLEMLSQKELRKFLFQLILALLILTFLGFSHSYLSIKIDDVAASSNEWLSGGWQYRRSHVINPAFGAGSNYQVRITAYYSSAVTKHYLTNWNKYVGNPLFAPANNRAWPAVIYHGGTYYMYLGYYTSGSDICLYTSTDGVNFTEHPISPILTRGAPGSWEAVAIEPHSVIYIDGQWRLYYCGLDEGGIWRIGFAYSSDLINWTKYSGNPIMSPVSPETSVADPQVFLWKGKVWMHYAVRGFGGASSWSLTVAWSNDGISFTRSSLNPIRVDAAPGGVYILNDNEICGLFRVYENSLWEVEAFHSDDGEHYTYYNNGENVITVGSGGQWDVAEIGHLDLIKVEDAFKIFYAGRDASSIFRIGLATTPTLTEVGNEEDAVYLNAHCRSDFGDLRFTDDDGVTLLDYWMETKVDGEYAVFWVKVADDLSINPATIYIYYGNPSATTSSNGESTFLLFDDFLGTTYDSDKWQLIGSPAIAVGNGTLQLQRSSYSGSWSVHGLRSKTFIMDEKRLIAKIKCNAFSGATAVRVDLDYYSVGQTNKAHFEVVGARNIYIECDGRNIGGSSSPVVMVRDASSDTYYTFYLTRMGSSYLKGWLDGTHKGQVISNVNDGSTYIGLFIEEWGSHETVIGTYDYIAVAKYVDPEPSHGAWGNEEVYVMAPTLSIGEFQAPGIVYANRYFYLNATINHPNGVDNFAYATVEIDNSIVLQWTKSTNTFSIQSDPNGYCTIDASGSIGTAVSSTAYKLSWRIKLNWEYPEGYKSITPLNTKVFDSQGESANGSQANLFYFEDDLIVYSASADDSRINPSQPITFTGTLYYEGTITPPTDLSGITAKVSLNNVLKGSTTLIGADGTFTISIAGESSVGNYPYMVYATTDEDTVQYQVVNVIVDKVRVHSYTVSDSRVNVGSNVNIDVQLRYAYDNNPVTDGAATINGVSALHQGFGVWRIVQSKGTVQAVTYNMVAASGNTYGITSVDQNEQATTVIWDAIKITGMGCDANRRDVGTIGTFWATAALMYDDHPLGSEDSLVINGISMTWDPANSRFEAADTSTVVQAKVYNTFTSGHEHTYGITLGSINGYSTTIIWDMLDITLSCDSQRSNVGTWVNFTLTAVYAYDGTPVSSWSANILRNGTHFASGNFSDVQYGELTYVYAVENVTENVYGLTKFAANSIAVQWENLLIEITDAFVVGKTRVDVGTTVQVLFRCRFNGNQSYCTEGTIHINDSDYAINATGWVSAFFTYSTVGKRIFTVTGVNVNGETDFQMLATSPNAIWDTVKVVSLSAEDTRIDVGSTAYLTVQLIYEYDNTYVTSGSFTLNGLTLNHQGNGNWKTTDSKSSVQTVAYNLVIGRDDTYGLSTVNMNEKHITIIWDRLQIIDGGTTKETLMLGDTVTIWFTAAYEIDNAAFTNANGTLYLNGYPMTWSTTKTRWEYAYTATSPGTVAFIITGVNDLSQGLTVINDLAGAQTITSSSIPFLIVSNSTITELTFNSGTKTITFTVSGPNGTVGHTNLTIAKALIQNITGLQIYIDESPISYTVTSTDYSWLIHFTYFHSAHKVLIIIDPQYSTQSQKNLLTFIVVLIVIAVAITISLIRKNAAQRQNKKAHLMKKHEEMLN